nr:MAG TPA: hypothetical protein [Caudoviricetes sp.]
MELTNVLIIKVEIILAMIVNLLVENYLGIVIVQKGRIQIIRI